MLFSTSRWCLVSVNSAGGLFTLSRILGLVRGEAASALSVSSLRLLFRTLPAVRRKKRSLRVFCAPMPGGVSSSAFVHSRLSLPQTWSSSPPEVLEIAAAECALLHTLRRLQKGFGLPTCRSHPYLFLFLYIYERPSLRLLERLRLE